MLARSVTACIGLLLVSFAATSNGLYPLSDDFIYLINSKQNSWRAGRNFPSNTPLTYIKGLLGAMEDPYINEMSTIVHDARFIASLPKHFDPRKKWPKCRSLNEIRDQGSCGSCWAFGAVETMTDRYCIYSNGTKNFHFSAEDLVSCCFDCGLGCLGGMSSKAFEYWKNTGIVSGGQYNSSEGCRPYEMAPCEHIGKGKRPKCMGIRPTPSCIQHCRAGYNVKYDKDKHYAEKVYAVNGEDNIKAELYINGPVEAAFDVFSDFPNYKSGVYDYTEGHLIGGHAIKLMGWGVENGKKYWLCANSWNNDWGDKGFFKVLRGRNLCGIESDVVTGIPCIK